MLLKLIILSVIFLGISIAGMAITILLKPKGRIPDTDGGHIREMRQRGISCARNTDTGCSSVNRDACCLLTTNEF